MANSFGFRAVFELRMGDLGGGGGECSNIPKIYLWGSADFSIKLKYLKHETSENEMKGFDCCIKLYTTVKYTRVTDLHFRHNITYFCSISPTKMVPDTVLRVRSNMIVFWSKMNQPFK